MMSMHLSIGSALHSSLHRWEPPRGPLHSKQAAGWHLDLVHSEPVRLSGLALVPGSFNQTSWCIYSSDSTAIPPIGLFSFH